MVKVLNVLCISVGLLSSELHADNSWVGNTARSPVPASPQLLALQLKPGLSGLRAPGRPLYTLSRLVLIQVT